MRRRRKCERIAAVGFVRLRRLPWRQVTCRAVSRPAARIRSSKVTGGAGAAAPTGVGRCHRHGAGRERGGGRVDLQHIAQAAFSQAQPEQGAVAVAAISGHRQLRQSPLAEHLIEHVQRQAPLLPVPHPVSHPRPGPPVPYHRGPLRVADRGVVPRGGAEQPPVPGEGRGVRGHLDTHPDLAVAGLAQGAGVLPGHTRRRDAVLREPRVVDAWTIRRPDLVAVSMPTVPVESPLPTRARTVTIRPTAWVTALVTTRLTNTANTAATIATSSIVC
jgi:hypothetical protein